MPDLPDTETLGPAFRAYQHIRDQLLDGQLAPGTRLVTRKLATELGTSLNPVREALNRLHAEGLIDHHPGAGASVRHLGRREIEEIYGMREALESYAAELAARHIGEDELEDLAAICDSWRDMAHALRDGRVRAEDQDFVAGWVDNTARFHELLVRASRNSLLVKAVATFSLQAVVFAAQRRLPPIPLSHAAQNWLSHSRLLRALSRRDGPAAAAIVRRQMQVGRRYMLTQVEGS